MAFATWMFGHVILAVCTCAPSGSRILLRGPRTNPAMVLWGLGAVAALALVVGVPG